jgi:hypothetical protein
VWERVDVNREFWWETCGKELVERPRQRWEDNIKIDLEEVRIHWIDLLHVWDRKLAVVKAVMTFGLHKMRRNS